MRHADCPFCGRIERGEFEATTLDDVVRFEPLGPVTPGHMLFVPLRHVYGALADPYVAGRTFMAAADWGRRHGAEMASQDANLITSAGPRATQTVWHLHVHYVPRRDGDGLTLPWTGQRRTKEREGLLGAPPVRDEVGPPF